MSEIQRKKYSVEPFRSTSLRSERSGERRLSRRSPRSGEGGPGSCARSLRDYGLACQLLFGAQRRAKAVTP